MFNTSTAFAVSQNVIGTRVEDEVVLLNFDAGKYYGLRGVAVRMWELLESGGSVDAIVDVIVREFEVPSVAAARSDVEATVEQLLDLGLICQC